MKETAMAKQAKKQEADVVDLELARLTKAVKIAYRAMRDAEVTELGARETAAQRRYELGQMLTAARKRWPRRGPNAAPWGEFLRACEINEDVALAAMKYAGYVDEVFPAESGKRQGKLPTLVDAGVRRQTLTQDEPEPEEKADRGAWCTPELIAKAVGSWDLDPFSNPRSHIQSTHVCMLEQGDDGLVRTAPGTYYRHGHGTARADESNTVWLQPDYGMVLDALAHYLHTRYCALLRLDTSTKWFEILHANSELILIPKGERIQFDPPPEVEASSNPYPHGLYYRHAKDATEEIRALCYEWRVRVA